MSGELKQVKKLNRKKPGGLSIAAPAKDPAPSGGDAQVPGSVAVDTLEIGVEFQLDLKTDDFQILKELGSGNGGTVSKVMHPATKIIMARKVIHVEANEKVRKNIVRELHIMKDCSSPHIVTFYGAFLNDTGDVIMCMEYMDSGSLDRISKEFGPVRVDVLGKITVAILSGLIYLYEVHRIMHRDIKPSNVCLNSKGDIKLCDFGVSGELVNSVADTFVGTSTYMAPERIQGSPYTVRSDVWSVGLTVMELAIGKFPFDQNKDKDDDDEPGVSGILDLLQQIVHEPPPRLPKSAAFPGILDDMLVSCLIQDADKRPTPRDLFDNDQFIQAAKRTPVDMKAWAVEMMEKNKRKSHLQPPLSPATQALLRSDLSNAGSNPTSGDIPISASSMSTPRSDAISADQIPQSASRIGFPPRTSSSTNGGMQNLAYRPAPSNGQ